MFFYIYFYFSPNNFGYVEKQLDNKAKVSFKILQLKGN